MPHVYLDKEDLEKLLKGDTLTHPHTGLRISLDDEAIKSVQKEESNKHVGLVIEV